ncbi:gliding motility-associated C-terminal domain-containing protein [bacterium]|nr:gliding motility-associated C-terminal domain-containing protein [bacterium]
MDLPEEVIDGLDEAYLPSAHSGNRAYWCGTDIFYNNGTFIGDDYITPGLPDDGGQSYCWAEATLITPIFNTAGYSDVYMSFWTWWEVECIDIYAFDLMIIEISVDGGAWTALDTLNPPFSRLTGWDEWESYSSGGYLQYGHWVLWTYDLSAYAGSNLQFRFHFDTVDGLFNGFRGWLIDDFYIGPGPQHGELNWNLNTISTMGVADCRFSPNPFDVEFSVWNSGGATVHDVTATIILPTGLHLAGGDSSFALGNIIPDDTANCSWQIFADDSVMGNRCITVLLTSADSLIGYRENFDDSTSHLFHDDGSGYFDYTDYSTITRAGMPISGMGFAGIPANAPSYPEGGNWYLTSNIMNLTGYSECYIYFWQWLNVRESGIDMQGVDGGIVEINVNGTGWQQIDEFATGLLAPRYNGYIMPGGGNPLASKLAYCFDLVGWVQVRSLDLIALGVCSPGDNIQVRFRFGSGSFSPDPSTEEGWYIDDFMLSSSGHPIGPYEITQCIWFPPINPPNVEICCDTLICSDDVAFLSAIVTDGTAPYTYSWFPTAGLSDSTSHSIYANPESTTTYFVVVEDYAGCVDTDSVVVSVDNIRIDVLSDTSVCPDDTAFVRAVVYGGVSPYSYSWAYDSGTVVSPSAGTTAVVSLSSGWAICEVVDNAGCSARDSVFIDVLPLPSAPILLSPSPDETLSVGAANLIWHSSSDAEMYFVIVNDETVATTMDTSAIFSATICSGEYIWYVIAQNGCGSAISSLQNFYTYSCEEPSAYIVEPMDNTWSSCENQQIIIAISSENPIDVSSIRIIVNSTSFSVDGVMLVFDGSTLTFNPPAHWLDGQIVSVCLDSLADVDGNIMHDDLCWNFFIDLSPPYIWDEYPVGVVDVGFGNISFHLDDTLSGLDVSSVAAVVVVGEDTFSYTGSEIGFSGDSFWIDVSDIEFLRGDTVRVCITATDTTDYCPDNILDTCWTFYIRPCDLVVYACEDAHICPGDYIELGAVPPYSGGTSPYSITWQLSGGTTIATTENPVVSPETTTTYILTVVDSSSCSASDTITVFCDFEPVRTIELLYPPHDTTMPPGIIALSWHALDGTSPILYDVIIDGDTVAPGISDTFYNFTAECGEVHQWTISAHNICEEIIPHCDIGGVVSIESTFVEYFSDTVIDLWDAGGILQFNTYSCDGPAAYIEMPMPRTWSSCDDESIVVRLEDEDGVVASTIVLEVEGVEYTVDSSELIWSPPMLSFYPSVPFADGDTVDVCLLAAEDIYTNTLTGDSLCWQFFIDVSPPYLCASPFPVPDTTISSTATYISIPLNDDYTGIDSNSLVVEVNGTTFTIDDSCISYSPIWCGPNSREIFIDSHCISYSGCDTIRIRIFATDSTDYCADNVLDTMWSFYIDCTGPGAEAIYVPEGFWSSCPDDSIVIHLWDSLPGVDTTTISLDITGYGIVDYSDGSMSYDLSTGMLVFRPPAPLPDWGDITVTLVSASDMLGNPLESPLSWTFHLDKIAPIVVDFEPTCGETVSTIHPDISIEPYDSGCGITLDSTVLTIDGTHTFRYDTGDLSYDGVRLAFDPDAHGIYFPGGSDVEVCWHLVDCAGDVCAPNFTDTCCTFYIASGGPYTLIEYPGDGDWVACDGDSILLHFEDENGIISSSIEFEVCTGTDCSDCTTYDISSPEVHGISEFSDSVNLWFVPSPPFSDGDTVCVNIIAASDSLGNTIDIGGYADSIRFFIDLSPPVMWNQYPAGEIDEMPAEISFAMFDSLSGLDDSSLSVFTYSSTCTTEILFIDAGISVDSTGFGFSLDDFCPCEPGETVFVHISADDSPDWCEPNHLDMEWFFICPGCDLVADACEDFSICPGAEVSLGAVPPYHGGIPPYTYIWTTASGETISTEANPSVSPDSTIEYILIVQDSYGCTDYDTVIVYVDFEPVSILELLYPPSDTLLPPGDIALFWHALDGTAPILYDVIIDGDTVAPGISDTFYNFTAGCGETHQWTIRAYNFCTSEIFHCDSTGEWTEEIDTIYYADSVFSEWLGEAIFHTFPCGGPVASVVRPENNLWSACEQESIIIRIDDEDGVADSTILLRVNGTIYTIDSVQMQWIPPYLVFYPFADAESGDSVKICLLSADDIYGNTLVGDTMCWFYRTDFEPPYFEMLQPESSTPVFDMQQDILIKIFDDGSGIDINSIRFFVDGVDFTENVILNWEDEHLSLRFVPENAGFSYPAGETIFVSISASDVPDYCDAHIGDAEWYFITLPDVGCRVVPDPFTPNNDGKNDFAVFDYPQMFLKPATIYIYDLYGNKIYTGEIGPVADSGEQYKRIWDGTDISGNPLPQGLYMYIIMVDGEIVCSGTVVIAR